MSEANQFRLLVQRRFGPFFGVQFLGALNDKLFKQALLILLAFQATSYTAISSNVLQNLAQALFVLPFLLFSATAGQLADKYEKSRLITITVAIELADLVLIGMFGGFYIVPLYALIQTRSDPAHRSRIIEETPVPVVPLALCGLWGSFFSRKDGTAMTKPWRLSPLHRIGLAAGAAVPPDRFSPEALHAEVLSLRGDWR